jgi:hypothetical protein
MSTGPTGSTGPQHGQSLFSTATTGFYTIMVGALVLIAGLAWNSAFQALFNTYLHPGNATLAKFIYALILTAIVVVIVIIFAKLFHQQATFH